MYAGYVTNTSMENLWRDKREICPSTSTLGTFLGGLVHNISEKGQEQEAFFISNGHPIRFVSIPKISDEIWDMVMSLHPKTLALCNLIGASDQVTYLFDETTREIYHMG